MILPQKNPIIFHCNICDFHSSNKKDYKRHNETKKHISNVNQSKSINFTQNYPKLTIKHSCMCGKEYKDNSGLWRHKKKCTYNKNFDNEEKQQELINYLLKENSEFTPLKI